MNHRTICTIFLKKKVIYSVLNDPGISASKCAYLFSGNSILRSPLVMEELGGRQGVRSQDGPELGHHL